MKKLFVPTSVLGKWSIGLFIVFILLFAFVHPKPLAAIPGVATFITGIVAIIKSKERSIPVFLTTLMGLFILIFCLGEVISPH